MSHKDYIKDLCRDSLRGLIDIATARLKEMNDAGKVEILVVGDHHWNVGFFRKDDIEGALECLRKEAAAGMLRQKNDVLQIRVERWFEDEVKDLIKEKNV